MLKGKQAVCSGGWWITNEGFACVLSDKQFKCSLTWRPGNSFSQKRERERASERKRKIKKKRGKASFSNWEVILVATEWRWEVRTSFGNYKISSLWLDVIDDYTVANSRPARPCLWDISFLRHFKLWKPAQCGAPLTRSQGAWHKCIWGPVLRWIKCVH